MSHSGDDQKINYNGEHSQIVFSIESSQFILGFIIGVVLGFIADFNFFQMGWIFIILIIILMIFSFISPATLRFLFVIIGFSIGLILITILFEIIAISPFT